MKSKQLALAVAIVALTGCDGMRQERAAGKVDTPTIVKELKSIETAWNADYNAHAVDKLAGYYADDAALANPGSALATNAASRRTEIEKFVSDPSMKLEFASDRIYVAESGELATTRGSYSIQTTDPATNRVRTDTGSYLTVWKKQADGNWKAVEDFITPGAPAAAQ